MCQEIRTIPFDWGSTRLPDRNGYCKIQALDPREDDRTYWDVFLSHKKRDSCKGYPYLALEIAQSVRKTLVSPSSIFLGFRERFQNDIEEPDQNFTHGFVYVLRPAPRFLHVLGRPGEPNTHREERLPRQLLLVYVTAERVILSWDWVDASDDDNNLPIDYECRFLKGRIR